MANSSFRRARLAVNTEADAVTDRLDGGTLRLYTGEQPATADTPVTTQRILAEVPFGRPAFHPAEDGVAKAHPLKTVYAIGTGRATWFRAKTASRQMLFDGSVGTSDADLILDHVELEVGAPVTIQELAYIAAKQWEQRQ